MDIIKKNIHFILPGGGVRGSFQAGFIYQLRKKYSDYFNIYRIDGTSVGALNGLLILLNDPEDIKNIWFSIDNIENIFNPWGMKPILNHLKMIYNGFFHKSIYQSDGLQKLVRSNLSKVNKDSMKTYNCVVTNVYRGDYEYINGEHDNIDDFIIASASPWIISPPVATNNYLYIDGGLLQTYPIDNVKNSDADIKLLLGYDTTHLNKIGIGGDNLINYLARLIDISRLNHPNIKKLPHYITKYGITAIENPLTYPFLEFSKENIIQGFDLGIELADKFANEHFLHTNSINPND